MDDPVKSGDTPPVVAPSQGRGGYAGAALVRVIIGWLIFDACTWILAIFHPLNGPLIVFFYIDFVSLIGIPVLAIMAVAAFVGESRLQKNKGVSPAGSKRSDPTMGIVLLLVVAAFFLYILYELFYALGHFVG